MNTLETDRLLIRPLSMADLEEIHRLLDLDLEWGGSGVSIAQRAEKLQFQISLAGWADTRCIYGDRAITLRTSGQMIGICGFRPWTCTPSERALYGLSSHQEHPFNALELGLGYALSTGHRGKGYATEAVKALIEYGFGTLGVRRIVALTERGNLASVALMKRVGMRIGINPDPVVSYPWAVGIIENQG